MNCIVQISLRFPFNTLILPLRSFHVSLKKSVGIQRLVFCSQVDEVVNTSSDKGKCDLQSVVSDHNANLDNLKEEQKVDPRYVNQNKWRSRYSKKIKIVHIEVTEENQLMIINEKLRSYAKYSYEEQLNKKKENVFTILDKFYDIIKNKSDSTTTEHYERINNKSDPTTTEHYERINNKSDPTTTEHYERISYDAQVSVKATPYIISYRNKQIFGIGQDIGGCPKSVGFIVDGLKCQVVPVLNMDHVQSKTKLFTQAFQDFLRQQTTDDICVDLTVRSTRSDEIMAFVRIKPFDEELSTDVLEEMRTYFYNGGPGSKLLHIDSFMLITCHNELVATKREMSRMRHVAGKQYITENILGLDFQISADSFFQLNPYAAEVLYTTIRDLADVSSKTVLLDICCGTGTISLVMAPHVLKTIGFDIASGGIEDAVKNADLNHLHNTTFFTGKAEKILPLLVDELSNYDDVVAVLNPGRYGVDQVVIANIIKCKPIRTVIYVSCRPHTAMNNFVSLVHIHENSSLGKYQTQFELKRVVMVDMFPDTREIELVLRFDRINKIV